MKKQHPVVVQVGIEPDTDAARKLVERTLGWRFVDHEDDGVWNVETTPTWPVNVDATINLTSPQCEVQVTIAWP